MFHIPPASAQCMLVPWMSQITRKRVLYHNQTTISLISAFVGRCLDTCSIIHISKVSRLHSFYSWAGRVESFLVTNPWRQVLSWHDWNKDKNLTSNLLYLPRLVSLIHFQQYGWLVHIRETLCPRGLCRLELGTVLHPLCKHPELKWNIKQIHLHWVDSNFLASGKVVAKMMM